MYTAALGADRGSWIVEVVNRMYSPCFTLLQFIWSDVSDMRVRCSVVISLAVCCCLKATTSGNNGFVFVSRSLAVFTP